MKKFNEGDRVKRRPGTLGANGEHGTVIGTEDQGYCQLVTVQFARRRETFVADTYVHLDEERRGK